MMSDDTAPHASDEALHDWIDDRLDAVAQARVARHVAGCAACRGRADAIRAVVEAAHHAPPSIAPPDADAMERAIAARLGLASGAHVLPLRPSAGRAARPATRRRTALLIAAGLALTTASSLVTARLVRRDAPLAAASLEPSREPSREPSLEPALALPARSQTRRDAVRIETDQTLAALRAAAAAGDRVLAAETLRVLERSLSTIDAAIDEAEAALARDPGDAALAALLARTYERKSEAVRRGAVLGSRS